MTEDDPEYRTFLRRAFERFADEGEFIHPLRTLFPLSGYKPSLPVLSRAVEKLPRSGAKMPLVVEFGVYKGRSINHVARLLPGAEIYGFDSFRGFPDDGRSDWAVDFKVARLPSVPSNVKLVEGMFADTLPPFDEQIPADRCFDLVHIDCDLYSSTKLVFDTFDNRFMRGTIIVFDELVNYAEFRSNEFLAFFEFLRRRGLSFRWLVKVGRLYDPDDESVQSVAGGFLALRRKGYYQNVAVVLC